MIWGNPDGPASSTAVDFDTQKIWRDGRRNGHIAIQSDPATRRANRRQPLE